MQRHPRADRQRLATVQVCLHDPAGRPLEHHLPGATQRLRTTIQIHHGSRAVVVVAAQHHLVSVQQRQTVRHLQHRVAYARRYRRVRIQCHSAQRRTAVVRHHQPAATRIRHRRIVYRPSCQRRTRSGNDRERSTSERNRGADTNRATSIERKAACSDRIDDREIPNRLRDRRRAADVDRASALRIAVRDRQAACAVQGATRHVQCGCAQRTVVGQRPARDRQRRGAGYARRGIAQRKGSARSVDRQMLRAGYAVRCLRARGDHDCDARPYCADVGDRRVIAGGRDATAPVRRVRPQQIATTAGPVIQERGRGERRASRAEVGVEDNAGAIVDRGEGSGFAAVGEEVERIVNVAGIAASCSQFEHATEIRSSGDGDLAELTAPDAVEFDTERAGRSQIEVASDT